MAPEFFLGGDGSARADQFSLGVIAYQMLGGGRLPYGLDMVRATSLAAQKRVRYQALREVPDWIDEAIRKAVHPEPAQRWGDVSEFVFALHRPDGELVDRKRRPPLVERDPLAFWKLACLLLALGWVASLGWLLGR